MSKSAGITQNKKLAFGIDPDKSRYRLRTARYQAMAESVAEFVRNQNLRKAEKLNLLDVGLGSGRSMKFIDAAGVSEHLTYFGVDNSEKRLAIVYNRERWTLERCDLEQDKLPFDSDMFDLVICEQVLEHLINPDFALQEIGRVLRPGGLAIIGVPILAPGLAFARKHIVPLLDRLMGKGRSHQQVFTYGSFMELIKDNRCFSIRQAKGFRIISGGPLFGQLENFYWWYKFNRLLGRVTPWLCPEIQVVAVRVPFATGCAAETEEGLAKSDHCTIP